MRKTCLHSIYKLAKLDNRVVFIGSDITNSGLEEFRNEFPERFFIEGIYEQHLVGMAAGLAFSGKIPYINTLATFITRRCYEQILIDLCIHDLPVRLIGSGGGTVYAPLGGTHVTNEDLAIMRVIPNMTVIAPSDANEMEKLMEKTLEWPHPIYIRMAKGGDPIVTDKINTFEIGKSITLKKGSDVLFISTGITSHLAIKASEELSLQNISASVLHIHTIKPLDKEKIIDMMSKFSVIITIEEHRIVGGLGSAVSELLAEANFNKSKKFARIGFPDVFTLELGSQNEIMEKYGINVSSIIKKTKELFRI